MFREFFVSHDINTVSVTVQYLGSVEIDYANDVAVNNKLAVETMRFMLVCMVTRLCTNKLRVVGHSAPQCAAVHLV